MKTTKPVLKSNRNLPRDHYKNMISTLLAPFRTIGEGVEQIKRSTKAQFTTISFFADAILLNLCFFAFYYVRNSEITLSVTYTKLFLAINLVWFPVSLLNKKFNIETYRDFKSSAFTTIKTTLYLTYVLSFLIIILNLLKFSRAHFFGTCTLYGICELFILFLYFRGSVKSTKISKFQSIYETKGLHEVSLRKFIADFLLVTFVFYALNYLKKETFTLNPDYEKALLIIYGVWFATAIYTGKFLQKQHSTLIYTISPCIKSLVLSIALLSVLVFLFRLSFYSRIQIFGTFILVGVGEMLLYFFYSDLPLSEDSPKDIESIEEAHQIFDGEEILIEEERVAKEAKNDDFDKEKFNNGILKENPKLLKFLQENIDLSQVSAQECVLLDSSDLMDLELANTQLEEEEEKFNDSDTLYKVKTIKNRSLSLFINLRRINDIRRINRFFLEIHKKLHNRTYFVGRVETIRNHRRRIFAKYPKPIAKIVYFFNFLLFRLLPKIPVINKLYFSVFRGRNRVLSQAEVLGRLYFCGFKIVATKGIGGDFYFIAARIKHPSIDQNPSYGPFIKLRRKGYEGKVIYINKFRTMHPYSEYLQEYIYENYDLQSNGKFNNDIRVTKWGEVFRRLWIDELPQIANFFKGDLALVGVRALSQHYFDLYPEDLRELRTKFYPGLVPPYYADLPKSFEEIIESEREYLRQRQLHPHTTNIKYLSRAIFNILFKKARSR